MTDLVRTVFNFQTMPKVYTRKGWAILNSYNDLWSDEIFETPEDARGYVERYWIKREHPEYIDGYTYVPAARQVTVSPDLVQNGVRVIVAKARGEVPADV